MLRILTRQTLWQLTQADINTGEVSNVATVVCTARNGEKLNGSSTWVTLLKRDSRVEIGEILWYLVSNRFVSHLKRAVKESAGVPITVQQCSIARPPARGRVVT